MKINTDFLFFSFLFVCVLAVVYMFWEYAPSSEEIRQEQIKAITDCQNAGLDVYQSISGDWLCKPKNYKQ